MILAVSCSRSSDSGAERSSLSRQERSSEGDRAQGDEQRTPGQKPGSKRPNAEEMDIDKLDIPDQIKEAIKSGRIPKEQIPEILARFGSGVTADPVNVEKVLRRDLNSYLVLNGIVEPERKVEIFSRLSAYIKEIVKEEGAYVQRNDILALLDDTEIKISYEQANIALEQAKLSLEEAEQNYLRYQELIKRDLVSEQEYQNQEAQYKQRKLDHQNRLEDFKNLQLQLNWTKIRSLSEGYITERLIEVGDRVNANQQVYTVEDFKPLLIRVSVPTSDAIKLDLGMSAEVMTEVLKGTVFNGDVKLINPRIDVQTGTVKVTVEVFDESLRLKPGMFVEVRIAIGQKENVIVIPRKAILYKQNKTFAFVFNQGTVAQREITLGLLEEDLVEVTSGLNEGETIVSVGVEGLEDGQRVEVLR
jgi:RND family efflux transporter MFP subunit